MAKYQQYEEYKDSGVEWLGEVPSHWGIQPLKHLLLLIKNGATTTQVDETDKTVPISRIETISTGEINTSKVGYINPNTISESYKLDKGDILFSHINSLSMIGNLALKRDETTLFHGMNLLRLKVDASKVNEEYFFWLLKSKNLRQVFEANAKPAINQASLSTNSIKNIYLNIPDEDEQTKIANFLDHETSQIDTLIDKQQTLIQLLKEKRQAVISHAVTPNKDEESAKLGYFIDILSGYSFPSAGYQAEAKGNTALLRGINVGVGALKWDETVWWSRTDRDGLEAFELEEGDIVFGMDRPWISAGARVAEVTKSDLPCLLLQRVIRIRANKNTYQPFIKLCLASKEFKFSVEADLTGVSVPHISPDQVKSFPIRDIGYEQQKLITDDAFEKMKVLDLIENSAEQAIQLMQERRTALISAAVTGKIDVRGWEKDQ